jgi:hypothetical protein
MRRAARIVERVMYNGILNWQSRDARTTLIAEIYATGISGRRRH